MRALTIAMIAVFSATVFWQQRKAQQRRAQLARAQTALVQTAFELSADQITERTLTRVVDRVRVIHDTTAQIRQEIPRHVPLVSDVALPDGFVRLHDAAATATLPGSAGDVDAPAQPVTAAGALGVIVHNDDACHANAAHLSALQDWLREIEEVAP